MNTIAARITLWEDHRNCPFSSTLFKKKKSIFNECLLPEDYDFISDNNLF